MTMADYRIRGPGLSYEQEFQHHGIMGQRWGVITRNVGVNYVPVGEGGKGNGKSGNVLSRGLNSFATCIKRIKDEQAAKKAAKPLNISKLSKRQISKLTNEQLNQAVIRARLENELFQKTHPNAGQQYATGKEKVLSELVKFTKDVGGDFVKNMAKGALNNALQNHILQDQKLDAEGKIQMLAAYGFKAGNELMAEAKRASEDLDYRLKSEKAAKIMENFVGKPEDNKSVDPRTVQRGIEEVERQGLGNTLSKSFKDDVAYNVQLSKFSDIIKNVDMSDPRAVAKAVESADSQNLGKFVPSNIRAIADMGKVDAYHTARSDYVKSVMDNPNISTSDKARAVDSANRFVTTTLKVKPIEGSTNSLFNTLYGDYNMGNNYNQYGPFRYSGTRDPYDTSTWD